jgi:hypothetical protein
MSAEKVARIDGDAEREAAKRKLIAAEDLVDKTYRVAVAAERLATAVEALLGHYETVVCTPCLAGSSLLT